MTCEVKKQSVTQESIMNVSHQQTTSQSHSERKERKSLTATSPMSPRSQGSQEEAPTTPVTPSSYRLASKNTRMSRSSKTPHDSNNSNDATEAVTVSDTDSASESSSLCLPCFFPNHRVLDGEYPRRVVKYANRRLTKAKIVPDARALQMPQLKHSHIKIDKLLGEGSFSSVFSIKYVARETSFEASRLPEDEELVCKVLRKKILNNPAMLAACAADLVKEGLLLARCNHPHILSIYGWAQDGVDAYKSGRHDAFFLVMGKLDTTLSDKLKAWRSFKAQHQTKLWNKVFPKTEIVTEKLESFRERLHILKDLGKAVVYLHSQNILHRDLKPDNIGFAPDGTLKIFDFDVARLLPLGRSASLNNVHAGETQRIFQMTRRVGSPRYVSCYKYIYFAGPDISLTLSLSPIADTCRQNVLVEIHTMPKRMSTLSPCWSTNCTVWKSHTKKFQPNYMMK